MVILMVNPAPVAGFFYFNEVFLFVLKSVLSPMSGNRVSMIGFLGSMSEKCCSMSENLYSMGDSPQYLMIRHDEPFTFYQFTSFTF